MKYIFQQSCSSSKQGPHELVFKKMLSPLSLTIKVAWNRTSKEWRKQIISEIISLAYRNHSLQQMATYDPFKQQCLAIRLLSHILNEFSPSSATSLNVSLDFHLSSQLLFEDEGYLMTFFSSAFEVAFIAFQELDQLQQQNSLASKTFEACSLFEILNLSMEVVSQFADWDWDTSKKRGLYSKNSGHSDSDADLNCMDSSETEHYYARPPISPPSSWAHLFVLDPKLIEFLFRLLTSADGLRHPTLRNIPSNLQTKAANSLQMLAALDPQSSIFESNQILFSFVSRFFLLFQNILQL